MGYNLGLTLGARRTHKCLRNRERNGCILAESASITNTRDVPFLMYIHTVLQMATMVEKIECCERSHAQLEQHSQHLRQQLETQRVTHTQQNAELRTVLEDSQAGLKHLMCEKVRASAEYSTVVLTNMSCQRNLQMPLE